MKSMTEFEVFWNYALGQGGQLLLNIIDTSTLVEIDYITMATPESILSTSTTITSKLWVVLKTMKDKLDNFKQNEEECKDKSSVLFMIDYLKTKLQGIKLMQN